MSKEMQVVQPGAMVQQNEPINMLQVIAAASRDPLVEVAKMRDMLELYERVQKREAIQAFNRAMRAAQAKMAPVYKSAKNEHTGKNYETLEVMDAAIRPIYTEYGFSLTFNSPACVASILSVDCSVLHDGGHTMEYHLEGALDSAGSGGKANKTPIQALGSTITYLRRYLTKMIFNLMTTDDKDTDGNAPAEPLTQQQLNTLLDMTQAIGPKVTGRFLDYMKVKTLEDIDSLTYQTALATLRSTVEKLKDAGK